jgi:hypothetical protein
MNRMTREGESPQEWDQILTPMIRDGFRGELTGSEISLIDSPDEIPADQTKKYEALVERLDDFILYVASSLGCRVVLSGLVHKRMIAWETEPKGPEKLRRLGVAMAQAARVLQKGVKPPVSDPEWYRFRMETVQELRLLFRMLAARIRVCPNPVRLSDLPDLASSLLKEIPEGFGHLRRNFPSFCEYIKSGQSPIAPLLLGGKVHASRFFDEWIGWATGRDCERLRQVISRMGSTKMLPS